LDCDDLLRQDHSVVDNVAEKLNDTSNGEMREVANVYIGRLDQQTGTLASQLKPDDKKIIERVRHFQTDLAKAQTALKELREIAAMLPDNSAMLLAQSSLVILTSAELVE
jgi:hypothetical protein